MGLQIISGASSDLLTVDPTSKAARVSLYDASGNVIAVIDRGAVVPGAQGGVLNSGVDWKMARLLRAGSDGALRVSDTDLMLYDSIEGAAVDTGKWIQTLTTQTITQAIATGTLFNASAITTTATGSMHTSHRKFPRGERLPIIFRSRQRHTAHGANSLIELGFGNPATAITVSAGDGAFWRKDGTGQYLPVIVIGGSEILGTPISNATFVAAVPTTDYARFEVIIYDDRVQFSIFTQNGVLVNEQQIALSGTGVANYQNTHHTAFIRTYFSGAGGAATQVFVHGTSVLMLDAPNSRASREAQSGMGYNSTVVPTTFLQAAQFANSADPAAAVLSNTTPSYTTLGGKFLGPTPTPAAAVTDFALFGFTVPTPYTFYFSGIQITCVNRGVAITGTPTILEWFIGFNASSGSLASAAPYSPMKVPLGQMVLPVGATPVTLDTIFNGSPVQWYPNTPLAVQPARTVIVGLRVAQGTATAAGFIRGGVAIDGWFE